MKLAFIGTGKIIGDALFAENRLKPLKKQRFLPDRIAAIRQKILQSSMEF